MLGPLAHFDTVLVAWLGRRRWDRDDLSSRFPFCFFSSSSARLFSRGVKISLPPFLLTTNVKMAAAEGVVDTGIQCIGFCVRIPCCSDVIFLERVCGVFPNFLSGLCRGARLVFWVAREAAWAQGYIQGKRANWEMYGFIGFGETKEGYRKGVGTWNAGNEDGR